MKIIIAAFIVGFAAGVYGYRLYIIHMLGRFPFFYCDYCEFWIKREEMKELFPRKKSKRK